MDHQLSQKQRLVPCTAVVLPNYDTSLNVAYSLHVVIGKSFSKACPNDSLIYEWHVTSQNFILCHRSALALVLALAVISHVAACPEVYAIFTTASGPRHLHTTVAAWGVVSGLMKQSISSCSSH